MEGPPRAFLNCLLSTSPLSPPLSVHSRYWPSFCLGTFAHAVSLLRTLPLSSPDPPSPPCPTSTHTLGLSLNIMFSGKYFPAANHAPPGITYFPKHLPYLQWNIYIYTYIYVCITCMIHLMPMRLLSRYLLSAYSVSEIIIGVRDSSRQWTKQWHLPPC